MKRVLILAALLVLVAIALYKFAMYPGERFVITLPGKEK